MRLPPVTPAAGDMSYRLMNIICCQHQKCTTTDYTGLSEEEHLICSLGIDHTPYSRRREVMCELDAI